MKPRHCPALLITAPASGHGKTAITAALARHHVNAGRSVRVFKTGPDYLDPMILEQASGSPVYQMDQWMTGEEDIRTKLYQAAAEVDIILIEGVMGLYDGKPSTADLARFCDIPVAAVIDAQAMAGTFGAIAYGLQHYQQGVRFAGVVANRIGSPIHKIMLEESLPAELTMLGAYPREQGMELPHRHLGLVQADEISDIDERLDIAAQIIAHSPLADIPAPCIFHAPKPQTLPKDLLNTRIAVACDAAFGFIYPANIELLRDMGAEIVFFSPLVDQKLPQADAVWLPGGYPELHLKTLEDNQGLIKDLHQHHQQGGMIYAECGGLLYLLDQLSDQQGNQAKLCGLIPGTAQMQKRLVALGLQSVQLKQGQVRGHTFHHSQADIAWTPQIRARHATRGTAGEVIYQQNNITASYLHLYFPSNPQAIAALFCKTS